MADKKNVNSVTETTTTNNKTNNLFSEILNDDNVHVNTFGGQDVKVPFLSNLVEGDEK